MDVLLRWSGLPTTVEEHKRIADERGSVWWGKWAKSPDGPEPISSAVLDEISNQLMRGEPTYAYLHNQSSEWRARMVGIEDRSHRPPKDLVPSYYQPNQAIDLWVRLTDFEPLPHGWMVENLVFARGESKDLPVHFRGMRPVYVVTPSGGRADARPTPSAGVTPPVLQPPVVEASSALQTDIDWLISRTHLGRDELTEMLAVLTGPRPQLILAGPPGTGKTWIAEHLAQFLTQGRPGQVRLVQFHPTYGYEDFVEGLRPVASGNSVGFDVVPGPLVRHADLARSQDAPTVIVVDEMNRANLPSVFGELLYMLEYRGRSISLLHREDFSLPANLVLIGTMNTADRSIRSIDSALRRRFQIFDCPPRSDVLRRHYESTSQLTIPGLGDGLDRLNALLTAEIDRHHTIGHSFLMSSQFDLGSLDRVWERQLLPLLEEYFFDQPDRVRTLARSDFWPDPPLT